MLDDRAFEALFRDYYGALAASPFATSGTARSQQANIGRLPAAGVTLEL